MPYIFNSLDENVTTQAHGKWFSWKPQEIKTIHNENLARFLSQNRGEEGLVEIPESVMEMDKTSPEYKQAIYELRRAGVMKFINKQNSVIRNLEISLRGDYERTGMKGNFLFEATKGELQAYKNLKKYKEFETREHLNIADEIQKVRADLYDEKTEKVVPVPAEKIPNPFSKGK